MTTDYHSAIATGAPAIATTFNTPLGQLDEAIGDVAATVITNNPVFTGTVHADHFTGDGSGLTGITGATGGISNTGSTTIAADSDDNGVGEIALQTGGVTHISVTAAGVVTIADATFAGLHSVYGLGDSLTADGTYLGRVSALLGSNWFVRNRGIGGNTTTQMAARLQTQILAAGDGEYLLVLGGINDIVTDVAAATIETNLQTIYTAGQAAGLKVVAITVTPFKNYTSWSAGRQTVTDDVNTWILNTAIHVDYRVDAYSALEDPGAPDALLAAYDFGDGLHCSEAGYIALGDAVHTGSTWTAAATAGSLNVSGAVSLNQPLLNTSDVVFDDITANGTLTAADINIDDGALTVNTTTHAVTIGDGSPEAADLNVMGDNSGYLLALYNSSNAEAVVAAFSVPSDQGLLDIDTSSGAHGHHLNAFANSWLLGYGGGNLGVGTVTPDSLLHASVDSAMTNTAERLLTLSCNSAGTPAAGFGSNILFELESTTTADQPAAEVVVSWATATHASRAGRIVLAPYDTAAREALRLEASGSATAKVGFFGTAAALQQNHIADPAGGGTADAEARSAINAILAALETYGLLKTS